MEIHQIIVKFDLKTPSLFLYSIQNMSLTITPENYEQYLKIEDQILTIVYRSSLKNIEHLTLNLPNIKVISDCVFSKLPDLKSIDLSNCTNLMLINDGAFSYCVSLMFQL